MTTHSRVTGVLLHPTSLPGRYGIGELGGAAHRHLEFLSAAGVGLWQILPLGPTGYGDSPYQSFSAFAGNPLLIALDELQEAGLLSAADLEAAPAFPEDRVLFGDVIDFKLPLLHKAYLAFRGGAGSAHREPFERFCKEQESWLADFALFAVAKVQQGNRSWHEWETGLRDREPGALARFREEHAEEIRSRSFWQYLFFQQWGHVREHARHLGIRLMGDIPIFVAHDSADVWARPDLFFLDAQGAPRAVAGVPPDYFSATGQLWGNPLYLWDVMAQDGYAWWIARFRAALGLVDLVRLDHFRGFEAYWEVPAGEQTAENGRWVKGPGAPFFTALQAALGDLPIVAENLGLITPEVEQLREQFGLPGMAILQFAFGSDPMSNDFIPHNFVKNRVAYTGTHDNDTLLGWWAAGESTRTAREVEAERDFAFRYMGRPEKDIHWAFIRLLLASVADLAIVPMQDLLGLGSEARMNLPGRPGGNWGFRMPKGAADHALEKRLREMGELYGRCAPRTPAGI